MLTWTDAYETGVQAVDLQHRQLFEQINHLEYLLSAAEQSPVELEIALNFLRTYAKTHFAYEEDCMLRLKCAAHERNKAAHALFAASVDRFIAQYRQEGPTNELVARIHTFACAWVNSHILDVDLALRACTSPVSQAH